MDRRDISRFLVGSVAGTALLSARAQAQSCGTPACFVRSKAEMKAGVIPLDTTYPPGTVDRYGMNADPGRTDMTAAFNTACKLGKTTGQKVTYGATWPYLVTGPIDCTQAAGADQYGFTIECEGQAAATTLNPPTYPSILAVHAGHVFDCSGAIGMNFVNVSVGTVATPNPQDPNPDPFTWPVYPLTCFFLARNTAGSSQVMRFLNCRVIGRFAVAIVYNFGSEEDVFEGCSFYNYSGAAGSKVVAITGTNYRGLTSSFIAIAPSSPASSTIGHTFLGGSFFNQSAHPTSDVFYIESARFARFYGAWGGCHVYNTAGGRSIFYLDTTNSSPDGILIDGFTGEAALHPASYGVYVGNGVGGVGQLSVRDSNFPNSINTVRSHPNVTASGWSFQNVTNSSQGGGISIGGLFVSGFVDSPAGGFSAGSFSRPNVHNLPLTVELDNDAYVALVDPAAPTNEKHWRLRSTGGAFALSAFSDSLGANTNPIVIDRTGTTVTDINFSATNIDLAGTNIKLNGKVGFQGAAAIAKPIVAGSRGGNQALTSLLTALASYGLIVNATT